MEANDEHLITSWREALTYDLSLICRVSDDERSAGFISFCEGLTRVAPPVRVTRKTLDDEAGLPGIEVTANLIYHAVPRGPELPPFLNLLSLVDSAKTSLSEEIMSTLDQLRTPCPLKLFISPECPFCPKSVKNFTPLPLANSWVRLKANPPGVELIRKQFLSTSVSGFTGCSDAILGLDYVDRLSEIDLPTLIMVGEDDLGTPVAASEAIHQRIPHSELRVLPSAAHLCNIEQAEAFNGHLLAFLDAHSA